MVHTAGVAAEETRDGRIRRRDPEAQGQSVAGTNGTSDVGPCIWVGRSRTLIVRRMLDREENKRQSMERGKQQAERERQEFARLEEEAERGQHQLERKDEELRRRGMPRLRLLASQSSPIV